MENPPIHPIVVQAKPGAEQLPAILARGVGVLVAAGAGTGKTTTLTARYLSLLAEGLEPRSIVAVTFTRRAAREMRNRLRATIAGYVKRADLEPVEQHKWRQILRGLDAARIGTIHSLFLEILQFHPVESGLEPGVDVLDEGQAALLQAEAVDEAIAHAGADPDLEPIFGVYPLSQLRPALIEMTRRRLDLAAFTGVAFQSALESSLAEIERVAASFLTDPQCVAEIEALAAALAYGDSHMATQVDKAWLSLAESRAEFSGLAGALHGGEWLDACSNLGAILSTAKQTGKNENWDGNNPNALIKRLKAQFMRRMSFPVELNVHMDRVCLEILPTLRSVFLTALERYDTKKRTQRAVDFNDVEALALKVLEESPAVRQEWNRRVGALLVDEYQDSNLRQTRLFELLAGEPGRRFGVGDPRQSIYGWRGASPLAMADEADRLGDAGQIVYLGQTHRAHAALVDFTNRLAAALFAASGTNRSLGDIALTATRARMEISAHASAVEIHLVRGAKTVAGDVAARVVAQRLSQLHSEGVPWESVAILGRTARALGAFENALEAAEIPFASSASRGLQQRPEVRELFNALRALSNPTNNLALFGFLRSPMAGLDDPLLVDLFAGISNVTRKPPDPGAYWIALQESTDPRARRAFELLSLLQGAAGRVRISHLLRRLIDETGYLAALLKAGRQRAARNVEKVLDEAAAHATCDVGEYLQLKQQMTDAEVSEGEAVADTEGSVHLMTVHEAKGLEFPVVVIADANHMESHPNRFVIDPALGLLLPPQRSGKAGGPLYARAGERLRQMESDESRRILYVAATRARDLLLVSGAYTSLNGWLGPIAHATGLADELARARPEAPGRIVLREDESVLCRVYGPECDTGVHIDWESAPGEPSEAGGSADLRLAQPIPAPSQAPGSRPASTAASAVHPNASPSADMAAGLLVHEAIAQWLFPADARFEGWLQGRIKVLRGGATAGGAALRKRVTLLLNRLAAHPLHAEIAATTASHHELPFIPPAGESRAALAGRIDLLYRTPSAGWVIVDFKTERIATPADMAAVVESTYAAQVRGYGNAIQGRLGGMPALKICFLDVAGGVRVVGVEGRSPSAT